MASKFSQSEVPYKDTRGCGSITIHGIPLECDSDGFIDAPADMEAELAPHGFVRQERQPKQTIGMPGRK
jgi:hypothetical protein